MSLGGSVLFTEARGGRCAPSMWPLNWIVISFRVGNIGLFSRSSSSGKSPLRGLCWWERWSEKGLTQCRHAFRALLHWRRDRRFIRRKSELFMAFPLLMDAHPCQELLYCGTILNVFFFLPPTLPIILLWSSYFDKCHQLHRQSALDESVSYKPMPVEAGVLTPFPPSL